jgi:glycosyltransferase involved in cell wall biosynthesis
MNALFDIILPTYNNCDELLECLQGFEQQTIKDFRLLICIDGSTDHTLESVKQAYSNSSMNIEILQHDDRMNHGRNATRNLALPHINAQYIAFLDSDAVPAPDFLEQHLAILNMGFCVSAGDLTYSNAESNAWANYLHTRGKKRFESGDIVPFQYITTGNLALPSTIFIELGGQDAKMKLYGGGDTEFAFRLHNQFNVPIHYAKHAIAYSIMQKSLSFALNQMQQFGAVNLRYIQMKHPTFSEIFRIGEILGDSMRSRIIRLLLHPFLGKISEIIAMKLPLYLSHKFIAHAVGSRILLGYSTKKDPFNHEIS